MTMFLIALTAVSLVFVAADYNCACNYAVERKVVSQVGRHCVEVIRDNIVSLLKLNMYYTAKGIR